MGRSRVIFVEDDGDTLAVLAAAMREEFAVWVARNGEQGLEVADELGFDADVIVVDLGLGEGMRGDQFVAEYRRRARRQVPVIVVSGAPRAYEIGRTMRAAAILMKPFDLDDLLRAVRLFTGQPREELDVDPA